MKKWPQYSNTAIALLQDLIALPSFSKQEDKTANVIRRYLEKQSIEVARVGNNVIAKSKYWIDDKPTLLLVSHHDTVKPNKGYTRDPHQATIEDNRLYGLGSNDAGGCLVSLLMVFCHFYERTDLSHNLVFVASAEEEISGAGGLALALESLPTIDLAIVGEPTLMNMAIAEKGLIVYDAMVTGTSTHVAHENSDNAVYHCIEALDWVRNFKFDKESDLLGPVKMTATQINGGQQHNVIPAQVNLVIDIRVNDQYSNAEIDQIIQASAPMQMTARSLRLNSSQMPADHVLVQLGKGLGLRTYGSPTLSDQYALSCPSVKMGPGDSTRSHTADEYIYLHEVSHGIDTYIHLLESYLNQ